MDDFYIPGPTVPGTIQVEFYGLKVQRKKSNCIIINCFISEFDMLVCIRLRAVCSPMRRFVALFT